MAELFRSHVINLAATSLDSGFVRSCFDIDTHLGFIWIEPKTRVSKAMFSFFLGFIIQSAIIGEFDPNISAEEFEVFMADNLP